MQQTIAEHLGLDLSTVQNFFMNARRRCRDRFEEKHLAAAAAGALGDSSGHLDGMDESPPESPGMSYSPLSPDAPVSPAVYRTTAKQPAKLPCMSGIFPTGGNTVATPRSADSNGHHNNLPPMSLGSARHAVMPNSSASTPPMLIDGGVSLSQSVSAAQQKQIVVATPRRREMSAALQESIAEVVDAVAAGHFDLPHHLLDTTVVGKSDEKFDHTAMLNDIEPHKSATIINTTNDPQPQQFVMPSSETDVFSNENLFRNSLANRQYDTHPLMTAGEDIKPFASELMRFNAILESNFAAKERENLHKTTATVTPNTTTPGADVSQQPQQPSHLLMFDSHIGILDPTLRSNYTPK